MMGPGAGEAPDRGWKSSLTFVSLQEHRPGPEGGAPEGARDAQGSAPIEGVRCQLLAPPPGAVPPIFTGAVEAIHLSILVIPLALVKTTTTWS